MRFRILFAFLTASLLACNPTNNQEKAGKDMKEIVEDEAFQDKHETPEKIDYQGKGEVLTFDTPDGKTASAYTLKTNEASNNYLFVFHEWWGLNDQIKQEADRLFSDLRDVNVMALDMYDGNVTDKREEAGKLTSSRDMERLRNIVRGATKVAGEDAKIATIGWCFGGGWSIHSTLLLDEQAAGCVIYYGRLSLDTAKELPQIQTDVLGIFAEQDKHITLDYANELKSFVEASGKSMEVQSYDADHAFANPSSPRYAETAAQKANAEALAFLKARF